MGWDGRSGANTEDRQRLCQASSVSPLTVLSSMCPTLQRIRSRSGFPAECDCVFNLLEVLHHPGPGRGHRAGERPRQVR